MKQFILQIPDAAYDFEPDTWERYFQSLQQMVNQMVVGYFKYHIDKNMPLKAQNVTGVDDMLFARQRMALYDGQGIILEQVCDCNPDIFQGRLVHENHCWLEVHRDKINSGNTENLLDAANGLHLEHLFPRHPKAHFKSQTEKDSPGLAYKNEGES